MQQMAERHTAELEGFLFQDSCHAAAYPCSLALSAEDQVAVNHMYEDQGIAVHYDEPMPFSSVDSDKGDNNNDGYDTDGRSHRDRIAIQHEIGRAHD